MLKEQLWMHDSEALWIELDQLAEEGKDVSGLREEVEAILAMGEGTAKEEAAAAFLDKTYALPLKKDVAYAEPSELSAIREEAEGAKDLPAPTGEALYDKVLGAWQARCAGCLLGKPYEGARRRQIVGILKDTNNYPPAFYTATDAEVITRHGWQVERAWIDTVNHMPEDDDTNYTTLSLKLVDKAGRDFTPEDVAMRWLNDLPILHVCTAERVAYRNLVALREPPLSAMARNPYREWIGAQIRGDFFGYINPGRMEKAAEMAWRDASISHVKNGIYGEMMISAMIAAAFCLDDMRAVILEGLKVIPLKSRLRQAVLDALTWPGQGLSWEQALDRVHSLWNEDNQHHWCHTISNAVICVLALLYGQKDLEKTIGIALLAGFDTDCNAATVGSVLGAMVGAKGLPQKWIAPLNDTLHTGVDGYNKVSISGMAKKTLEYLP